MTAKEQQPVQQSLLDRLIDERPEERSETPLTRAQSIHNLKAAVRRDLEWLLNTQRCIHPAGSFSNVKTSVFTYGLPDMTSLRVLSVDDRQRLLEETEQVIRQFEPRLASVRVMPVDAAGNSPQELRFQIEALLLLDPAPELITFDTTLDVVRNDYQVKA